MRCYELFIDESGHSNPLSQQSEVYVLCGCVIENQDRQDLKIRADQIKFKYWGKTDIVFHSRELGKNLNNFEIFGKNSKIKVEFHNNLFSFLKNSNYSLFIIVIDKK